MSDSSTDCWRGTEIPLSIREVCLIKRCSVCGKKRPAYLTTLFGESKCRECVEGPAEEKEPEDPLTLTELIDHARELSLKHWGVPFDGKIELIDRDWKRRMGVITFPFKCIRFSRPANRRMGKEQVLETLLHELVHWWLYTQGKPHKDNDPEFIMECVRVGAPISGTQAAQQALRKYGHLSPEDLHPGRVVLHQIVNEELIEVATHSSPTGTEARRLFESLRGMHRERRTNYGVDLYIGYDLSDTIVLTKESFDQVKRELFQDHGVTC